LLSKKFELDITTLTKINFYLLVPAFSFVYIFTTEITSDLALVILLSAAMLVVNFGLGIVLSRILKLRKPTAKAFQNSLMFFNVGNIGVSLILLVFSNPPFVVDGLTPYVDIALSVQVMILLFQNLTINTIGIVNSGGEGVTLLQGIRHVFRMPAIYTIICAFLFKLIPFDLTATPLWPVLVHLRNGLISVALVTLGVQLAKSNLNLRMVAPYGAVFFRLIIGPVAAFLLIRLFGFSGIIAQVIFISSSTPAAVNTALLAVECNGDSDFAVQVVTLSTLFSAVTMTLAVYLSFILF